MVCQVNGWSEWMGINGNKILPIHLRGDESPFILLTHSSNDRFWLCHLLHDRLSCLTLLRPIMKITHVLETDLWWVRLTTLGSIWIVLWLSCVRSAPSTFPQRTGLLYGAISWESLVFRLYSEIGQIHLSIEAQCDQHKHLMLTDTLQVYYWCRSTPLPEKLSTGRSFSSSWPHGWQ